MNKLIVLPHGLIQKLSEKFECSRFTVSGALRTNKPGKKKDEIRAYVQELYNQSSDPGSHHILY